MTNGYSEIDVSHSDIARFYPHQRTRAHVRARTNESFNKTYGSLCAGICFMTWIWISAIVILVGEEVNEILKAAKEPQKEQDKGHPLGVPGKASCRAA